MNDFNEFVLCVYNKQINLLIFYILFYCFTYRIFSKLPTKYIKYVTHTPLRLIKSFHTGIFSLVNVVSETRLPKVPVVLATQAIKLNCLTQLEHIKNLTVV